MMLPVPAIFYATTQRVEPITLEEKAFMFNILFGDGRMSLFGSLPSTSIGNRIDDSNLLRKRKYHEISEHRAQPLFADQIFERGGYYVRYRWNKAT